MAKKKFEEEVVEIKKYVDGKRVVFGTDQTVDALKTGRAVKVFLSSTCPAVVQEDIERYAAIGKVAVVKIKFTNEELGTLCRKPFSISVLGVLKPKE